MHFAAEMWEASERVANKQSTNSSYITLLLRSQTSMMKSLVVILIRILVKGTMLSMDLLLCVL